MTVATAATTGPRLIFGLRQQSGGEHAWPRDVRVRLLGTVDVVASGTPIAVPGSRRRSVLAVLALRAGQAVAVESIIDAVWGSQPPATARNTVQAHVAALRRLLPDPSVIRRSGQGYELVTGEPATDAAEVRQLLARADTEPDPVRRLPLLEHAAALWRGDPLVDAAASEYLQQEAATLANLRQAVTERLVADRLRLGAHRSALPAAQQLVAANPLNERATELLMLAQYRSGGPADAVTAYRRLERSLRAELDVEPSPTLQRLAGRIRERDPRLLLPGGWSAAAGANSGLRTRRQLLLGRDRELTTLLDLLRGERLLTIGGIPGVGKSTLVREAVRRARADGARIEHLELAAVGSSPTGPAPQEQAGRSQSPEPGGLVALLCERLGVHAEDQVPAVQALAARLDADQVLVLDGWGGSRGELADVAGELLARAKRLRVSVVCDRPLGLPGERRLQVEPLPVPEPGAEAGNPGVELLLHSARLADPAFDPAGRSLTELGQLCRRVGGLPLALALVGSRLPVLTPGELADVLEERMLGWTGHPVQPSHEQHLGALLGRLLEDIPGREAHALDRLSFLRGGTWGVDAATLCASDAADGEQVLGRLAERSLIVRTDVDGRSWVTVHSLVARFVQDRLHSLGRHVQEAEVWAGWMEKRLRRTAGHWHGPHEPQALHGCTVEAGNVRAVLEYVAANRPRDLCRSVGALWWWWYRAGMAAEGRRWAAQAVATGGHTQVELARAHAAAGYLAWLVDDYDAAVRSARQALEVAGDDDGVAGFAHGVLARAVGDTGDFAAAADEARCSVAAYERAGQRWGAAWSQRLLASALVYGGAAQEAVQACDRARRDFEAVGDAWGVAGALDLCSRAVARSGDRARARELAVAAVEALRACGDTSNERYALQQLAESAWADGDVPEARRHAEAALDLARRHGYQVGELQAVLLLGDVAVLDGDAVAAEALQTAARRLAALLGPAADVSLELARRRADLALPV